MEELNVVWLARVVVWSFGGLACLCSIEVMRPSTVSLGRFTPP